jgi:hypothetical protein
MHLPSLALRLSLLIAGLLQTGLISAQSYRWLQRVNYNMEVSLDVESNRYTGKTKLWYYNNSPDTLTQAFFHLYNNAFQPGSMMDERSRTIADPDRRVADRISNLQPSEIGFLHVTDLQQGGVPVLGMEEVETILEVRLAAPILPGDSAVFEFNFAGQSPVQIRRSGRDNKEGIRFSMAQWYPKMCEYDHHGWHSNPYIGREFHGVWGDFDVVIKADKNYTIAATGILQNPNMVGHGYEDGNRKRPSKRMMSKIPVQRWHFRATNVHDFAWAADPDYTHLTQQVPEGPTMHFFYQADTNTTAWSELPDVMGKVFKIAEKHFGKYAWDSYSFIQAGDGGMEYPMCTFITGNRSLRSLVGVSIHELMHSWFQGALAFDESHYYWMDEGFTSYATAVIMGELYPDDALNRTHINSYINYFDLVEADRQEPMTTHADHFHRNRTYSINAYSKGAITLHQLSYVIGKDAFQAGMLRFFSEWKFRHPDVNDYKRVMEKTSGLELDWYFEYWINTTKTIDYAIMDYKQAEGKTLVELRRYGSMPMPVDLEVKLTNGESRIYNIPLTIMRGEKAQENKDQTWTVLPDWKWTHRSYKFEIDVPMEKIKSLEIDPTYRMADTDRESNFVNIQRYLENKNKPD